MSYNNLYSSSLLNLNKQKPSTYPYTNNSYNTYNYNTYTSNKQIIKVDTTDDYYINVSIEHVNLEYDFIIINAKNIYLLNINDELYVGLRFKIINTTNNLINVYSQNDQLIYNSLYIPKEGTHDILINSNSLNLLYVVKNQKLFSWIMV